MFRILVVILIFCFGCSPKNDVPITINLDENWTFKKEGDTIWKSATVPGNVYSDLLDNKSIEHPFIANNEEKLQWISDTNWIYKTSFSVDKETLGKKRINLNFEGLDTYALVVLNDSLILKSSNAFRQFSVDVKSIIKARNELRIMFERTSISEEKAQQQLGYQLPEGNRIFTRKAQFQYGWDWGPKLNTSGIWKPIKLYAWNDFIIEDIEIKQIKTGHVIDSMVALGITLDVNTSIAKPLDYDIFVNDSLYRTTKDSLTFLSTRTFASSGIIIENPKLWWPHNLGEPYMYTIKVVVRDGNTKLDSISVKKGIRTIALVSKKDSIGESFFFEVNGKPVYAKGANYIPQNSMQNHVTDAHYEKLLNDVVDANMNMLRVWGGGIYENDIFYDLCDEKGILVWQDFMFACAMYPGDKEFLKNVTVEAEQQVKRLRHHASIVLWCGNNENSEGWHRWGWQAGRSEEEKQDIWNNYLKVFDSILPNAVEKYTEVPYWESSPKYGRGNPKYKTEGDAHDWWIWHDAYPFEHLEENVPRFMSEFGFQSFPSYEAIRFINQKDSLDITSDSFVSHQKHSRGFQLINDYMQRDFPVPVKADDYVYMSQLLQAYGITKGIEAQRRAKPYNMGTLYWQLNDCWPVVSWSSIDFFGNWKALHYKAKRSFENVLVSSIVKNERLNTYAINDNLENMPLDLDVKLIDFNGRVLLNNQIQDNIDTSESKLIWSLDLNQVKFDKTATVLLIESDHKTWLHYFSKPKDLKLKSGKIQKKITKTPKGFQIELSSITLQKDVFLYCNEVGHFSDNYFDLMPNETKTIMFTTKAESLDGLNIKTFNNFIR